MNKFLADIPIGPGGGFRGLGPLGLEGKSAEEAPTIFNKVISSTVGIMTVIAVIWFVVQFVSGAVSIISSGGDKAKLQEARNRMTTGVMGLAITVMAIFIIQILGQFIGIDLLKGAFFVKDLAP